MRTEAENTELLERWRQTQEELDAASASAVASETARIQWEGTAKRSASALLSSKFQLGLAQDKLVSPV